MRRLSLLVALVATFALAGSALAAGGSTTWKLYSFNASGQSLKSKAVPVASNGSVSFTFPKAPDAAYLLSTATPSTSGGNLHATVSVATAGATFAYYPSPSAPAMVGLYFETKSSGGFNPSNYWWSGSSRVQVDSLTTPLLMTASLNPADWTNFYGKPGDQTATYIVDGVTYPSPAAGFAAAVAHITSWGVSFGGGSFYANGVGTPTGSAIFTLAP